MEADEKFHKKNNNIHIIFFIKILFIIPELNYNVQHPHTKKEKQREKCINLYDEKSKSEFKCHFLRISFFLK